MNATKITQADLARKYGAEYAAWFAAYAILCRRNVRVNEADAEQYVADRIATWSMDDTGGNLILAEDSRAIFRSGKSPWTAAQDAEYAKACRIADRNA